MDAAMVFSIFRQPFQQNDRRGGRKQQSRLGFGDVAIPFDGRERGIHQREWFFFATLAFTETPHRFFIPRIHHQLKSAQSFEGNDLASANRRDSLLQGFMCLADGFSSLVPQRDLRAAFGTGVWLRVKTAISWIVVFRLAFQTHREPLHRSVARSYGNASMMLKRGPQLVQFVNG